MNNCFLPGKKIETKNGCKADIVYISSGYLCGHVKNAEAFHTIHWDFDGFAIGSDDGFDLVVPKVDQFLEIMASENQDLRVLDEAQCSVKSGLDIIAKYVKREPIVIAAKESKLISVSVESIVDAGIAPKDAKTLRDLNWMIDENHLATYI